MFTLVDCIDQSDYIVVQTAHPVSCFLSADVDVAGGERENAWGEYEMLYTL